MDNDIDTCFSSVNENTDNVIIPETFLQNLKRPPEINVKFEKSDNNKVQIPLAPRINYKKSIFKKTLPTRITDYKDNTNILNRYMICKSKIETMLEEIEYHVERIEYLNKEIDYIKDKMDNILSIKKFDL